MKTSHWSKMFLPLLLIFPAAAWADAYDISVQGYVEREEEAVTGTIECEFALYSDETGGEAIWSLTEGVTVDGGIFTASLGADDFPEPEDFPADLYLGMTCDGEEFSPRLQFTGVPMAHRAEYAERAGVADSIAESLIGAGLSAVSGGVQLDTAAVNTWSGAQTFSSTVNVGGSVVVNSATISPAEFSLLDGKDAALIDINDTNVILESHLKAVDAAADEECLTYESTVGDFEWQSCGGVGSLADDSVDFDKIADAMTLDAATTIGYTATGAVSPLTFNLTNNASAATAQQALRVINAATSQETDVNTEALLLLDNADTDATGSTVVDDALRVTVSGGISGGVTDAIDVSDVNITNALNIGTNTIAGTTGTIDLSYFDVTPTGAVTTGANGEDGSLTIFSEQGGTDYSVVFQPNAAMTQNVTYTLPADDGGASQVLQTDANGALSWATVDTSTANEAPTGAQYVTLVVDGTLSAERVLTAGDGLTAADGGAGSTITLAVGGGTGITANADDIATASGEAGFLAAGALVCGDSTAGKMQVHTTPLQYCDNAGTPTLQYAAYADSSGNATGVACTGCVASSDVGTDLDFADFDNTLDLDAGLTLNQGTNTWTQNFTGDTTTGFTFNADSVTEGTGVLVSADALTSGKGLEVTSSGDLASGTALSVSASSVKGNGSALKSTATSTTDFPIGMQAYNLYLDTTNSTTAASNYVKGVLNILTDATNFSTTDFGIDTSLTLTGDTNGAKVAYGVGSSVTNTNSTDQGTRTTYAGYFAATGSANGTSTAYGVYAKAASADTNYGIYAEGTSGATAGAAARFNRTVDDGTIVELAQAGTTEGTISVSDTTVSYNAFTGSHYTRLAGPIEKGMLVRLTGDNGRLHDAPGSEIIYGVEETVTANDPAVLGAYLSLLEPSKPEGSENPHLVMAVGNGVMWVADDGEDLAAGDYLISSDVAGHAMKDSGEYPVSHVVARLAEPVDWNFVEETVDDGTLRKHKLVSVLFTNFDLPHEERSSAKDNLLLRSPGGSCFRVTVDDDGRLNSDPTGCKE